MADPDKLIEDWEAVCASALDGLVGRVSELALRSHVAGLRVAGDALAFELRAAREREQQMREALRPGAVWVNRHTGDQTTITDFASRVERLPVAAGGFKDDPQLVVHHTCNAPPGFTEGYGDDLTSFIEHWGPAALSLSPPAPEEEQTP